MTTPTPQDGRQKAHDTLDAYLDAGGPLEFVIMSRKDATRIRIEQTEILREKIYAFLHVLPETMNEKYAISQIDYEFEEELERLAESEDTPLKDTEA